MLGYFPCAEDREEAGQEQMTGPGSVVAADQWSPGHRAEMYWGGRVTKFAWRREREEFRFFWGLWLLQQASKGFFRGSPAPMVQPG